MPVLNKYKDVIPSGSVYVGRGSRWGNPFIIGKHGTRDDVCDEYAEFLKRQWRRKEVTLEDLAALHGKDLVCFCAPLRCHGDTLVEAAEWAFKQLKGD